MKSKKMISEQQVSVIIPIYNKEKYINRCLDSVIAQTYRNLEIILIDDGSTDASLSICRQYEERDLRVKVITKPNGGVSSARNCGLEHCTGELIAFVDPDDWLELEYFAELVECLQKYHADIACCYQKEISEHYNTVKTQCYETGKIITTHKSQVDWCNHTRSQRSVWGAVYKKYIINGIVFAEDISIGEDTLFFAQAAGRMQLMVKLDKALYNYSLNDESAMGEEWNTSKLSVFEAYRRMKEIFKDDTELYPAVRVANASNSLYIVTRYYADNKFIKEGLSPCEKTFREDAIPLMKCLIHDRQWFSLGKAVAFWIAPRAFIRIYHLRYLRGRKR